MKGLPQCDLIPRWNAPYRGGDISRLRSESQYLLNSHSLRCSTVVLHCSELSPAAYRDFYSLSQTVGSLSYFISNEAEQWILCFLWPRRYLCTWLYICACANTCTRAAQKCIHTQWQVVLAAPVAGVTQHSTYKTLILVAYNFCQTQTFGLKRYVPGACLRLIWGLGGGIFQQKCYCQLREQRPRHWLAHAEKQTGAGWGVPAAP